ncbi:MAG: RND family efflux transporter MFP subunit [Microgenomates group bacterium GW2011_GWF2_47_9]|nr:MAG: RND family efflux transporter MFP subunit [Microgenomates group bacterium GW2011_GWF2_47_9]
MEARDLTDTLELAGEVTAQKTATLRFSAGGYLTYLGASEGDSVKKWQTLASVDSRQLKKVLDQKLNLFAIQRGTFDQTIDDNDNSVPDGDLDRTLDRLLAKNQYQLDNTILDVEYQSLAISLARLSAPFDGILVHAPVSTAYVQVLATDTWLVVDPQSLEFTADLDETDIARVAIGQKVVLTLDAFPDLSLDSTIASISFVPQETSTGTTYKVKVALPKSEMSQLKLGLNGTASVVLSEKTAVPSLPVSAITLVDGASTVTVLESDKYATKKVETGVESGNYLEIKSGLGVGDHVYVKSE